VTKYTPDPKNARRHPERNKAMIRQSLEEVGPFRSIGVDGDGIVRAGNGVYEQAQSLGLKVREVEAAPDELIAVRRPDLRGEQAERAALWDNRSNETSEWDASILSGYDLDDMFNEGEQDEIRALAESTQMRDAGDSSRILGEPTKQIKPVLYLDEIATFEQAIRLTGERNRGKALLAICQEYIDQHGEGDTKGQLDLSV
jgi:hypothetical protein